MRRSTVANWFNRMHRPTSFRMPVPTRVRAVPNEPTPAWEDLRLESCTWSDGQILDLRLSCQGVSAARCLVARKGIYLVEPTGPVWARKLLEEAVVEWCASDLEAA